MWGQGFRPAAVTGLAREGQEAAAPNAAVTLKNLDTGIAQSTRSDAAGAYEFAVVKPGMYSVKVDADGFRSFLNASFTVNVEERVRVDAALQVGDAASTITVEAAAAGVQTESSSLGEVVTNKK